MLTKRDFSLIKPPRRKRRGIKPIVDQTGLFPNKVAPQAAGNATQRDSIVVVQPISTTTTLLTSFDSSILSSTVTFTATVSSVGPNPIGKPLGSITFLDRQTSLGIVNLANGVATLSISSLTAGIHSLTAQYNPSVDFQPSISTPTSFTVKNPLPDLNAIYPASTKANGFGFILTLSGNNILPISKVRWGGVQLTTFYEPTKPNELTAGVSSNNISLPAITLVSIFNSGPGGGDSINLPFEITSTNPPVLPNPVPTTLTLNPTSRTAGSTGFQLAVTGQSFVLGASVLWNGQSRPTTFLDSQNLTAQILTSDLNQPGIGVVQVLNPLPGGGYSNLQVLKINPSSYPPPTLTSLSPVSITTGGPAFSLVVTGTNFTSFSIVKWNDSPRNTVYISSTLLLADIGPGDIDKTSTATINVSNPGIDALSTLPVNIVANCQLNVITSTADTSGCGTLRGTIQYLKDQGGNASMAWEINRTSQLAISSPLTLDRRVSLTFPCGQDGKPQLEIKVIPGIAGLIIDNRTAPVVSGIPLLSRIKISGAGGPLLQVLGGGGTKVSCVVVKKS